MLFAVFLPLHGRDQAILGIVVDHCFRQHALVEERRAFLELFRDERRDLIQIKINGRDLLGAQIRVLHRFVDKGFDFLQLHVASPLQ